MFLGPWVPSLQPPGFSCLNSVKTLMLLLAGCEKSQQWLNPLHLGGAFNLRLTLLIFLWYASPVPPWLWPRAQLDFVTFWLDVGLAPLLWIYLMFWTLGWTKWSLQTSFLVSILCIPALLPLPATPLLTLAEAACYCCSCNSWLASTTT